MDYKLNAFVLCLIRIRWLNKFGDFSYTQYIKMLHNVRLFGDLLLRKSHESFRGGGGGGGG